MQTETADDTRPLQRRRHSKNRSTEVASRADGERAADEQEALVEYYREATRDYAAWSDKLNMHFGYSRWGLDVLDREAMLEQMTDEVLDRLGLSDEPGECALDLGCGVGASMRRGARRTDTVQWFGVTKSRWQVRRARKMNMVDAHPARLHVDGADYRRTPYADSTFDAAYAIEAACHAAGPDKEGLVEEASRLLRPGGRFVVADVLRTDGGAKLGPLKRWAYRTMCDCWAVDELAEKDALVDALERHGFRDVQIEDVSWNVAPCALWIPFVTLKFLWSCWRSGESLTGWRRAHVVGSVLAMIVGLCRANFSYCIVTATREADDSDAA